ncbi:MAG: sterol desaturase family protein [Myxococcales bacterium]|nr:sterol desaturase family protein [Myxococcales bacterium]
MESLANVAIYVGDVLVRIGTWPLRLGLFALVYTLSPFRTPATVASALTCYLAVDLLLYWYHRLLHETALGWALHSVHHSGRGFNLSLSVRASWLLRAFDDIVYLPLALLGFEPLLVLSLITWNRSSQYWAHTEMIGRLSWIDPWLNTPSNHRVHHAVARGGPRANYGSNFMLWDHLFGTYQRETAADARLDCHAEYGTDAGDLGSNPITIQLAGIHAYVRTRRTL